MTIDDDMDDDNEEYKQAIAVQERVPEQRRQTWSQVIPNHLGPDAGTANPTFVSRLVELQGRGSRSYPPRRTESYIPKFDRDEEMLPVFASTDGGPPPPPGAGAVSAIPKLKSVRSKSVKERRPLIDKKKDPDEIDAEMNNGKPPPPPPPPPDYVFHIDRPHCDLKAKTLHCRGSI